LKRESSLKQYHNKTAEERKDIIKTYIERQREAGKKLSTEERKAAIKTT
jgi:hypothetical protein